MALTRFLIKRSLHGLIVVWGVLTAVFALRYLTPGSPVDLIAPLDAPVETREAIARDLGLHQPIYIQYLDYMIGILQGDLGYSYHSGTPAAPRVIARLGPTIELAVMATLIAILIAIPLGVISATNRLELKDYGATLFSLVGISTPNFWIGIMLILIVGVYLGWLPTGRRAIGFHEAVLLLVSDMNAAGLRVWLAHIIMPAVTLGTFFTALLTRLTRNGMLDELGKTYIKAAYARGLPKSIVVYKHVLRNTLAPIVTVLGLQLGSLIGGAVIVEAVFAWPGIGNFLISAIFSRDWPLIQATLIVVASGYVIANLAVDTMYAYLDPRVALE